MRRVGLADGLGIVAALTAVMYVPGFADPFAFPKLLVLFAGGLALAPAVFLRWRSGPRPALPVLVVCGAVGALIAWGVVSTFASGAPWPVSLFGWWGRADGLMAWFGAAVLLLGAARLSRAEVPRTVTWLLGGATVVGLVGVLQALGLALTDVGIGGAVTGLMGNTNFAGAYFSILAILALGRVITQAAAWQRIWAAVLFVVLAVLSFLTQAQQGPASLVAGLIGLGVAYALLYRGRWRVPGLVAAAAVVVVTSVLVVVSFFGSGPLARLWAEDTLDFRQAYWSGAWRIMNALPVFGTGPDGLARYIGEYQSESFIKMIGPAIRVSAAHNVALQFGAVVGWLGLVLWVVIFFGAALVFLVRIVRAPVAWIAVTASAFAALGAYLAQAMVSIDMLPLLATGWLLAGIALALAQEPPPKPQAPDTQEASSRKAKARSASRTPIALDQPRTPTWVPVAGGILALGGVLAVGAQITAANAGQSLDSQQAVVDFATNPLTPCFLRVSAVNQGLQQFPIETMAQATYDAAGLDERCPPIIIYPADVALITDNLDIADSTSAQAIEYDPLLDIAWILRARYLLAVGDVDGAQQALDEAARVQALYPAPGEVETLAEVQAQIDAARG